MAFRRMVPRDIDDACRLVLANNATLKGSQPSGFLRIIHKKAGPQLQQAIAGMILDPRTRERQIADIMRYGANWWTVEDLIVKRPSCLPSRKARKQARLNHECYERIRNGLTC